MTTRLIKYLKSFADSDYFNMAKRARLFDKKTDEAFLAKNRIEVLTLYRHMLKTVPYYEKNLFKRTCLKERIKFNFQEGSTETDIKLITNLKNSAYIVIEKINSGIFPPFPDYQTF